MAAEREASDEKVRERTGRGWKEWFRLIDDFGGRDLSHKEIAGRLTAEHGMRPWWSQAITVEYERAIGRREPGQKPAGFELSVQRTIGVSLTRAWDAWAEPEQVSSWFTTKQRQDLRVGGRYSNSDGDAGEFLKVIPKKLLRFTWENPCHEPGSQVEVTFASKGRGKSVVRLTHSKLANSKDRGNLKEGWSWALDSFKSWLETGKPVPSP